MSNNLFPQQIVFDEEFQNNENNWPVTTNFGNNSFISEGKFTIELHAGNILLEKLVSMDFNETRDFVIETSIIRVDGHTPYGISWGASNEGTRFNFVITDSGKYAVNKWEDYLSTPIINYTYSKFINPDSFSNKLTIKKTRNKIQFYVNGKFLTQILFQKFYGHKIGLYAGSGYVKLEIQYLKVYYPFSDD